MRYIDNSYEGIKEALSGDVFMSSETLCGEKQVFEALLDNDGEWYYSATTFQNNGFIRTMYYHKDYTEESYEGRWKGE